MCNSHDLLIKQCNLKENLELSGTIKVPSHMATWLSPNGSAKKHSLYNKHPSACGEKRNTSLTQTHRKTHLNFSCKYHFKCSTSVPIWESKFRLHSILLHIFYYSFLRESRTCLFSDLSEKLCLNNTALNQWYQSAWGFLTHFVWSWNTIEFKYSALVNM